MILDCTHNLNYISSFIGVVETDHEIRNKVEEDVIVYATTHELFSKSMVFTSSQMNGIVLLKQWKMVVLTITTLYRYSILTIFEVYLVYLVNIVLWDFINMFNYFCITKIRKVLYWNIKAIFE